MTTNDSQNGRLDAQSSPFLQLIEVHSFELARIKKFINIKTKLKSPFNFVQSANK